MKRPAIEEFKRLCSPNNPSWGMADADVIDLCDYIVHLESQHAALRAACVSTLEENAYLADGDDCTLIDLKRAILALEA